MNEVYRARDERLRRDVVIKVLPYAYKDQPFAVSRFIREGRAASSLNHPNIVTIFDSGQSKEGLFIIMEFVVGRTLRDLVGKDIPPQKLTQIVVQIAKALSAAHAAGIVHRDIKPENIMVRDDGFVKVLDFGLARWEEEKLGPTPLTQTASGALLGTLRYMSPEQAACERPTTASDIFSLGIVVYELMTGKHPFNAASELETLQAIASRPIVSPSHWNPELSPVYERMIVSMLDRNPRRRPAAADIVRLLEGDDKGLPKGTGPRKPRHILVGRHGEFVKLRALLDSTVKGSGLLVLITGEPGIGKTTLVEDFLAEQLESQRTCAIGRGASSERLAGTEGYLPLLDALEDLLRNRPILGPLMRRVAPNWYDQVWRDSNEHAASTSPGQVKAASRELLNRELVSFLEEASFAFPIVLFLDDLHWADESTMDLLALVSTYFRSSRILILASYRPEEMRLNHERFSQVALDLQARGRCRIIDLAFLEIADVDAYLSLEFPQNDFPAVFPRLVHDRTEGNPFFMVEVVRYLRDKHVISQAGDIWSLSERLPDIERDLPQTVIGMLKRKIDLLADTDRRLLAAASVQGFEFESIVVARTLSADTSEIEERLDALYRIHGFVQPLGERELPEGTIAARYRFVHFLYYGAFYDALQPARKASWSAAAAEALVHYHQNQTGEIAAQLAFLYESARDFSQASHYFSIASENATKICAYHEGELLARRGLRMLENTAHTPIRAQKELDLQLKLGMPLLPTKGYGNVEVQRIYDRAHRLCVELGENPHLFPALWGLQVYYTARMDIPAASDITSQLLRFVQTSQDPTVLLVAHLGVGAFRYGSGDFEQALEHFRYCRNDNAAIRIQAAKRYGLDAGSLMRGYISRTLWMMGYTDECLNPLEESLTLARSMGHATTLSFVNAIAATTWQNLGHVDHVDAFAQELTQQGVEHGFGPWLAQADFFAGWVRTKRERDPAPGLEMMRKGLADYRATGTELFLPHGYSSLSCLYEQLGLFDDGLEVIREAFSLPCLKLPTPIFYSPELLRIKGDLLAATGSTEEAEALLRQALEIARQQRARTFELRTATSLSRFWRARGKTSLAQDVLKPVCDWFAGKLETPDLIDAREELARVL
jgi:adenylate cyclase